jgi:hypothetical protein
MSKIVDYINKNKNIKFLAHNMKVKICIRDNIIELVNYCMTLNYINEIKNEIMNYFISYAEIFYLYENNSKEIVNEVNILLNPLNKYIKKFNKKFIFIFSFLDYPLMVCPISNLSGCGLFSLCRLNKKSKLPVIVGPDYLCFEKSKDNVEFKISKNSISVYSELSDITMAFLIGKNWYNNVFDRDSFKNRIKNRSLDDSYIFSRKANCIMNIASAYNCNLIKDIKKFNYIFDDKVSSKVIYNNNLLTELSLSLNKYTCALNPDNLIINKKNIARYANSSFCSKSDLVNFGKNNCYFDSDNDGRVYPLVDSVVEPGNQILLDYKISDLSDEDNFTSILNTISSIDHYGEIIVLLQICWLSKIKDIFIKKLVKLTFRIIYESFIKIKSCRNIDDFLWVRESWCYLVKLISEQNSDIKSEFISEIEEENFIISDPTFQLYLQMLNFVSIKDNYTNYKYILNTEIFNLSEINNSNGNTWVFLSGKVIFNPFLVNNLDGRFVNFSGAILENRFYGNGFSYIQYSLYKSKNIIFKSSINQKERIFFKVYQKSYIGRLYHGYGYDGNEYFEAFYDLPHDISSKSPRMRKRYLKNRNKKEFNDYQEELIKELYSFKNINLKIFNNSKTINFDYLYDSRKLINSSFRNSNLSPNSNCSKDWIKIFNNGNIFFVNINSGLILPASRLNGNSGWCTIKPWYTFSRSIYKISSNLVDFKNKFMSVNILSKNLHRKYIKGYHNLKLCKKCKYSSEYPYSCEHGMICRYAHSKSELENWILYIKRNSKSSDSDSATYNNTNVLYNPNFYFDDNIKKRNIIDDNLNNTSNNKKRRQNETEKQDIVVNYSLKSSVDNSDLDYVSIGSIIFTLCPDENNWYIGLVLGRANRVSSVDKNTDSFYQKRKVLWIDSENNNFNQIGFYGRVSDWWFGKRWKSISEMDSSSPDKYCWYYLNTILNDNRKDIMFEDDDIIKWNKINKNLPLTLSKNQIGLVIDYLNNFLEKEKEKINNVKYNNNSKVLIKELINDIISSRKQIWNILIELNIL